MNIKQKIISLSRQAGACSIGFADIVEVSDHWKECFEGMLSEGRHGTMAFMERNRELRQNPALLFEGGRTLISLAFNYDKEVRNPRIASYALVPDYHHFLRQLLEPIISYLEEEIGAQTRICVDSAPVAERFWALRTGVGVRGRNQQLMVPGVGARVFLAEIITTAHIPPDPIVTYEGYANVCIGCDRCVRACPNGALEDPDRFDARKCVSYLTIEHRGDLPKGVNLAGKIYGCDICLDACPYNRIDAWSSHIHKPMDIKEDIKDIKDQAIGDDEKNTPPCEEGKDDELTDFSTDLSKYFAEMGTGNLSPVSSTSVSDKGIGLPDETKSKENFYNLHKNAKSPFEIDTDILSLTTQDIENMTSGQYRRLTKKSAMSRCPIGQLRRNL